ncbi:MAG: ROK family protein [Deltaproteobacteria bacterium]|jgi:glucokinase|nr:ROK family protein [Deltaproteobacteria bacterium]
MELESRGGGDLFLALDVGGTSVKCGLVTRGGAILRFGSFPTAGAAGPEELIALMARNLEALRNEAPGPRPKALAVGAPGWIKPREGIVVTAPNLPGWSDVPVASLLSRAMDMPVLLENDANLYALGEWLAGAGRGADNMLCATLGTGVGGGLILGGALWSGSFTSAAEIGHIPAPSARGRRCGCGREGCLETVASASGAAALFRERLAQGGKTLYRGRPEDVDAEAMAELARGGDPLSLEIFREAGEALGWVLAGVFNLLGLERVVIGGGGAGAFAFLEPSLKEVLRRRVVTAGIGDIGVVKGTLGGNAPLVGAAALLAGAGY